MPGVVGDVEHVLSEPNHRRLVTHGIDPVNRPRDRAGIGNVALDQLGLGVEVIGPLAMGRRQQAVEYPDGVAVLHERVDDVRADEAGAAGDQNHALHATAAGSPGEEPVSEVSLDVRFRSVACAS